MGGAGLALINGTAGTLFNASASAVRLTTDNDHWTWDWHFDYLNGQLSSDFDNNGTAINAEGAQLLTLGLGVRVGKWSGAITSTIRSIPLDEDGTFDARNLTTRIAVARWFPSIDTAIGVGLQAIAFQIRANEQEIFNVNGAGVFAGATWLPAMENYRVGISLETPIVGGSVGADSCEGGAAMCMPEGLGRTLILPNEVEAPGRTGAGIAYRWAETAWNQQVKPKYRDERAVTAAVDLWFVGSTKDGHGIEKFAEQELQRSGVHTGIGVRGGVEVEAIPGRLRLRGGSYWEPERFDNGGRLHGTFGFEVRVGEFYVYGIRRGRLGITTDIASRYRNIGLSIGLWH